MNPCLCHWINCGYKSVYRKCEELKEAVDMLRGFAAECKDHLADVLDVCPGVQQRIRKFFDFDEQKLLIL